jgi:hypothetical protein
MMQATTSRLFRNSREIRTSFEGRPTIFYGLARRGSEFLPVTTGIPGEPTSLSLTFPTHDIPVPHARRIPFDRRESREIHLDPLSDGWEQMCWRYAPGIPGGQV